MNNNKEIIIKDSVWLWNLFATSIGAGVLYLPVNAGINGLWPFMLIISITVPMIYLSHRNLSKVVLASSKDSDNINELILKFFSPTFSKVFAACYFLAIYPLIPIYSVGIMNTLDSILSNIYDIQSIHRPSLSLLVLSCFFIITRSKLIRLITEYIALPLAVCLFAISVYLIPYWKTEAISFVPDTLTFIQSVWLTLPVIIFSFNFSPTISMFTLFYLKHHKNYEKTTENIIWKNTLLLFTLIIFFVVSCILSVTPELLQSAKEQNMNILVFLGKLHNDPIIHTFSPIIAIIAMSGAFLGSYNGAKEAVIGLIEQKYDIHKIEQKMLNATATISIFVPSYLLCIYDTNILNIISIICGPVIAILLFIFPIYAYKKVPVLHKYHKKLTDKILNYFILISGLISCSAIMYSFKYIFTLIK